MSHGQEKHSLDVALDHSLNLIALAIRPGDKVSIKVHSFAYQGRDHYVAYALKPSGDETYTVYDDCICDRAGLYKWIMEHTEVKTIAGAQGFLSKQIGCVAKTHGEHDGRGGSHACWA